jgi:hypothetical protein
MKGSIVRLNEGTDGMCTFLAVFCCYDKAGAAGRSFMSGVIMGFKTRRVPDLTTRMEAAAAILSAI